MRNKSWLIYRLATFLPFSENRITKFLPIPKIEGEASEAPPRLSTNVTKKTLGQLRIKMSQNIRTRGNTLTLETSRSRYDRRKYFFTERIVSVWNSLPVNIA